MVIRMILAVTVVAMMLTTGATVADDKPQALDFTMKSIDGKEVNLAEKYKGKVVLMVNVASKCGYTKQYTGLEALHDKFADQGLAVVGFPCNQFGGQEPGSDADIKDFCKSTYEVEFDLYSKIDVNGDDAAPLYKYLTSDAASVDDQGPVKWNFEKFLYNANGELIKRYRSKATPAEIAKDIEVELAKK